MQALNAFLDAQIQLTQDVRAAQLEQQKHVSGPAANAFDFGEFDDDFFVEFIGKIVEVDELFRRVAGEVSQVAQFLA